MNNSPEQLMQRLLDLYQVISTLDVIATGLENTEFEAFSKSLVLCARLLRAEWDALMEGIMTFTLPPHSGGVQ